MLQGKTVVVKLSGGKDSTASLLYMLENYHVDYVVYQHTPDNMLLESEHHVRRLVKAIERDVGANINFVVLYSEPMLKLMREKHKPFPNPKTLWCGYWLKLVPFRRWLREEVLSRGVAEEDVIVVVGLKRADSRRRKTLMAERLVKAKDIKTSFKHVALDTGNYFIYSPILDWSDEDVWSYLRGFPETYKVLKEAYEKHPNISACLVCPYHNMDFYSRAPREMLLKIKMLLEEMKRMEHITQFKLGYQMLLKHLNYVNRFLEQKPEPVS